MLLLTLRGTPTLYYGDEIGMPSVEVPYAEQRDPQGLRGGISRDQARTPMRWQAGPAAGFCTGEPWLPIGPAVAEVNVAAQRDDPGSMLSLHHRLLGLRRAEPALNVGGWNDLGTAGTALAYLRSVDGRRFLVALNLGSAPAPLPAAASGMAGEVVVSALAGVGEPRFEGRSSLAPDEGLIVVLD
jgi:alpha-glucosidase